MFSPWSYLSASIRFRAVIVQQEQIQPVIPSETRNLLPFCAMNLNGLNAKC